MTQRSAIADTICRTTELGVTITDASIDDEDQTHLFCQLTEPQDVCGRCGVAGRLRDHVEREVTDLPIVGHPTRPHLRVPRYTCVTSNCATSIFRADLGAIVAPRSQVTRRRRPEEVPDLGPRQRAIGSSGAHGQDWRSGILRRSAQSMAARNEREHQWVAATVLPQRN